MIVQHIDTYIQENYDFLLTVAKGLCFKNGRKYDPCVLITEAYLHCIKIKDKIEDVDTLQRYMIAKISIEVKKPRSAVNRRLNIQDHCQVFNEGAIDPEEINFTRKKEQALEEYRTTRDAVKKRVFEVYYDEEIHTVRAMAQYFNISTKKANQLINEMKDDIRQIHEKLLYY